MIYFLGLAALALVAIGGTIVATVRDGYHHVPRRDPIR